MFASSGSNTTSWTTRTLPLPFRSAEEALLAGGRGLADAWTKARSEQTEELMPLAASTVEAGSSRDRPAHALHLPAPPVPVRKGVTLSQQAFSADSVNRRVEALAKVFEDAGIHRPSVGNLSDAILAEWKLQLTRLAQVKVTKSEPQTVVNAVRTWSELVSFMLLSRQDYDRAFGFGVIPGLRLQRTQVGIELASLVE